MKTTNDKDCSSVTRLYSLDPLGVNTAMVESLTSYITRLSAAHCVSVGTMISKMIIPALEKPYLTNLASGGGTRLYARSHAINGYGDMAMAWITELSYLTGQKRLSELTLVRFRHILTTRSLLSSNRTWCPQCLQDQAEHGRPVYEPLLWSLQCVMTCPIHGITLQNVCPSCSKQMPVLERKTQPGRCSKCEAWLGQNGNLSQDDSRRRDDSYQIGNFLIHTGPCHPNQVREVLSQYIRSMFAGNIATAARQLGYPKTTLWGWVTGKNLPTLPDALTLAGKMGVNLPELYSAVGTPYSFELVYLSSCSRKQADTQKRRILDLKSIESGLKTQVNAATQPKSLKDVSHSLGVDSRVLRQHYPDLCKHISARYRAYLTDLAQSRQKALIHSVKMATHQIHEANIYPSRRRVEEYISAPGALHEQQARSAWHEALQELGLASILSTTVKYSQIR